MCTEATPRLLEDVNEQDEQRVYWLAVYRTHAYFKAGGSDEQFDPQDVPDEELPRYRTRCGKRFQVPQLTREEVDFSWTPSPTRPDPFSLPECPVPPPAAAGLPPFLLEAASSIAPRASQQSH